MQAAAPIMAIGSLVQGIGSLASGQANRKAAEATAQQQIMEGNEAAGDIASQARMATGRQLGVQAESGFMPGTGSALDSLRESNINAAVDALRARRKAASAANASIRQAAAAAREGTMGLVSGLTGAAGAVAGHKADFANMGKAFGFGSPGGNPIKVLVDPPMPAARKYGPGWM